VSSRVAIRWSIKGDLGRISHLKLKAEDFPRFSENNEADFLLAEL
jgi:hypothetical protein